MKIGIIVYSQTGNTLCVARELKEKLADIGHQVDINEVRVIKKEKGKATDFKLDNKPEVKGYDLLIFGSPVHAFNLALEMKAYLTQLTSAEGKKALCYVTHSLFAAKRSVKQMAELCKSKGIKVVETGFVTWSDKKREGMKEKLISGFAEKLGN